MYTVGDPYDWDCDQIWINVYMSLQTDTLENDCIDRLVYWLSPLPYLYFLTMCCIMPIKFRRLVLRYSVIPA